MPCFATKASLMLIFSPPPCPPACRLWVYLVTACRLGSEQDSLPVAVEVWFHLQWTSRRVLPPRRPSASLLSSHSRSQSASMYLLTTWESLLNSNTMHAILATFGSFNLASHASLDSSVDLGFWFLEVLLASWGAGHVASCGGVEGGNEEQRSAWS